MDSAMTASPAVPSSAPTIAAMIGVLNRGKAARRTDSPASAASVRKAVSPARAASERKAVLPGRAVSAGTVVSPASGASARKAGSLVRAGSAVKAGSLVRAGSAVKAGSLVRVASAVKAGSPGRAVSAERAVRAANVVKAGSPGRVTTARRGVSLVRAASVATAAPLTTVRLVRARAAAGPVGKGAQADSKGVAARVSVAPRDVRRIVRSRAVAMSATSVVRAGGGSKASAKDVQESATSRSRGAAGRGALRTANAPMGRLAIAGTGRRGTRSASVRRRSMTIRCCPTTSPATSWTRRPARSCARCRRNWRRRSPVTW
ncbi:hypothetical protein SAMN06265355_107444 [Actinomadura mexicana]|uniref:Uncharacterized protein n=1 Tax=Actinomadura mexicana TaxID=134959 RepID=A0A238ZR81_9ACTN|nr:hypothetical protein SAMN06265355_107444 [Actinomadura mexicana]